MNLTLAQRILPIVVSVIFLIAGCKNQKTISKKSPDSLDSNSWKIIGPGGGGGVFLPTISPFDENFVLTHCDMSGAYITYNGGKDWRMFNLWTVPADFEFDPVNSSTVYTATRGYRYSEDRGSGLSILYRSQDKGKRWRIIYPDVSKVKVKGKLQSNDYLPSEIVEGAFDGSIDKIEVDPSDNRRIYLGISPLKSFMNHSDGSQDSNSAMLIRSVDYGESWKLIGHLPGQRVKAIFPVNASGYKGEVIVFTESACVRINESTGKIIRLPLPVDSINVVQTGQSEEGSMFYIQSPFKKENGKVKGGMYLSKNMGESWIQINNGLISGTPADNVPSFHRGLAVCESKPEVAYVSMTNSIIQEGGAIEKIYSIFKTSNAGESWEAVLLSSTPRGYITKNFEGSWIDDSYDPGWGGSPYELGVAPGNPDICYAVDDGRCYRTIDGGKFWKQVYSHNNRDSSYTSGGLNVTTCYGVHFDPFDEKHFFISYTDIGLFHTFDFGKSWIHSLKGIPKDWENTCYWIEFDPKVKGRVWSVWGDEHDLPRTKMFMGDGFSRSAGGVAVSDDNGLTWRKSNTGMPEYSVCTNILLDTTTAVDARTLYVSVMDKGIYKSNDGGKSWKEANNGLGDNLFAWQLRRNSEGRLFALFSRGQRVQKTVNGAIYFSDDNAETWKQLQLPKGVNGPHDLLLNPGNAKIMYVSCWPRGLDGKDVFGGVFKTEDGGLTWKQVFDESIRVNSAGMDTKQTNRIFINTFHNAAYRSEDSGQNWKRIEGYRFKWGQRAIPDIHHPGMLFLTTYGGSVFYGPANGLPNAFEDIENMPEGWW